MSDQSLRERLESMMAVPVENDASADNLAIALLTYFQDMSDDECETHENGWPVRAVEAYDDLCARLVSHVMDTFLSHLADNGLAIVPVEATDEMLTHATHLAMPDEDSEFYWTVRNMWDDTAADYRCCLEAAPPAADLLKGTQDE